MAGHDHSLKPYWLVLFGLFALTGLTVLAAYVHLGSPWADVVALAIAMSKASLVVAFFMHVRGSSRLVKFAVWTALVGVAIFFALVLSDVVTRAVSSIG